MIRMNWCLKLIFEIKLNSPETFKTEFAPVNQFSKFLNLIWVFQLEQVRKDCISVTIILYIKELFKSEMKKCFSV